MKILVILLSIVLTSGCGRFNKEDDYSDANAQELYDAARKSMSGKRYETAVEILRTLEAKYPYGKFAQQAQIDTIYVYYMSDQPGLALAAADRFIKLNPTHDSVDYAYYLKGLVSYEEDKTMLGRMMGQDDLSDRDASSIQRSLSAFEELIRLFPDSQYGPEARKRAKYLRNALAKNEIAVAKYYYSREAFVAVVNRAKGVIESYSSTPSIEQALALMMFSYTQMGFNDLSDDTRRILQLNFPNSNYLTMKVDKVKFTSGSEKAIVDGEEDEDGWVSSVAGWFKKDAEVAE
jgi:outer membrane protein assembly factor BamD